MPILDEYLYSIGALVDSKGFKKAQQQTDKFLKSMAGKWNKYQELLKEGDKKQIAEHLKSMTSLDIKYGKMASGITKIAGEMQLAMQPLLIILDATKASLEAIFDLSTKVSNQFITMQSLFVDKDVRNIMAMTGVGTVEAQGIRTAEELTGISIQELPFATPAQQEMFADFIERYTAGISSLDPGSLEAYNETVQQFQRVLAETKLDLQLNFMKMIISTGPQLEQLFDSLTTTMQNFSDLVESQGFQVGAKLFIATIQGIVDILSAPINLSAGIMDFFKGYSGQDQSPKPQNINIEINSNATMQGNASQDLIGMDNWSKNNAFYIANNIRNVVK